MTRSNRLDSVRRRVQLTRYAVGVVAVGVFAGGVAVARAAHPGGHHVSSSAEAAIPGESDAVAAAAQSVFGAPSSGDESSGSSNSSGSSSSSVSPAPAASPPVVQSSGS